MLLGGKLLIKFWCELVFCVDVGGIFGDWGMFRELGGFIRIYGLVIECFLERLGRFVCERFFLFFYGGDMVFMVWGRDCRWVSL